MAKKVFYNEDELVFVEHPKYTQFIDRIGHKFGQLTVLGFAGVDKNRSSMWYCRCECERITRVYSSSLISGKSKSCGCISSEAGRNRIIHGYARNGHSTPEYRTWSGMMQRVKNSNSPNFGDYGGRGISICERWEDIDNFIEDMGIRPNGTSIERINNNGDYCKDNCYWATRTEQQNNRRNNKFITYNGDTKTIAQWENEYKFPVDTIRRRIKYGWTIDEALTTPVRQTMNRHKE